MYATEEQARAVYAGDAPDDLLSARMAQAAGVVAGLSLESEDPEYEGRASAAELLVGEYLFQTGGVVRSEGVLDASTTYGSFDEVKKAASDTLGPYALSSKPARGIRSIPTARA